MDAKQIIKDIMIRTETSQGELAVLSGMAGQTNVTGILNRGVSLRVDKMVQMLTALGYKLVVMPAGADVQAGWYEIDATPVPDKQSAELKPDL